MGRIIPQICADFSMKDQRHKNFKRSRMQFEEHGDVNDDYDMVAKVTDPECFRCRTRGKNSVQN